MEGPDPAWVGGAGEAARWLGPESEKQRGEGGDKLSAGVQPGARAKIHSIGLVFRELGRGEVISQRKMRTRPWAPETV